MVTIFDSTRPVKTARPFGAGILRRERFVPTPEDEAWWAAQSANWEPPADCGARAAEAAALDRLERGLCC
jgi:hypothetical protein